MPRELVKNASNADDRSAGPRVRSVALKTLNTSARMTPGIAPSSTGGVTAPPFGLYLVDIGYPEPFVLPRPPLGPLWLTTLNAADGGGADAP